MVSHDHAAIVLGLSPTGLAVARSLAPRGVKVFGVDKLRLEIGHFSRYVRRDKKICLLPPGGELLSAMRSFGATKSKRPVVFAAADAYVDFVAANRHALTEHFILADSMCEEVNSRIVNKRTFYERCLELGVAVPKTFFPTDEKEASHASTQLRYPAIVKPTLGHLFRQKLHGDKLVVVNNADDLLSWWRQFRNWGGDSILQEEIVGPESNIFVAAVYTDPNLTCRSLLTARKCRQYPPQYGSGSYMEAHWSQDIADLSIALLEKIEYRGVCGTEYKWDDRDGEYKLIEVNCRPTLWFALCKAAGVDVIWDTYCDLIGEPNPIHVGSQNDRMRWQFLVRDLPAAIHFLRRRELSARDFFRTAINPMQKEFAVLSLKDPGVWLGYPINTAFKFYDTFYRKRDRNSQ